MFAGKEIDSVPNRNKSSKWYTSREVYPYNKYPLWFQGLVYFLSPQHTGQLFETALDTHYMHTDDVFMGIIVNKTKSVQPYGRSLQFLSEFAIEGFDLVKTLQPLWEDGKSKLFHVPNIKVYYTWSLKDLDQSSRPPISWL